MDEIRKQISSLLGQEPEDSVWEALADSGDEVRLVAEADHEIGVLDIFNLQVDAELEQQRNSDISTALANPHALDTVNTHKHATIEVLEELRRRAFGKVVTLENERGEQLKYRVSQANYSIIKGARGELLNVVNRLAPVSRKLAPAEVGDVIELPQQGECEVISIDLLDRFDAGRLDTFSQMQYLSVLLEDPDSRMVLSNVRSAVDSWKARYSEQVGDLAEISMDLGDGPISEDESESLGSNFYTRTTKAQEELMSRPARGLLIVEGIAGSGKTSVALGRVKQLHDARYSVEERDEFFADQSSMTGFVLNKQLIIYLEKAVNELGLPNMRVREFKDLQSDLLRQRAQILQLKIPGNPKGAFSALRSSGQPFESSMNWLRDVERSLTTKFLGEIRDCLQKRADWIDRVKMEDARLGKLRVDHASLLHQVWDIVSSELISYIDKSENTPEDRFLGEGLAKRLKGYYEKFYDLVSEDSRWYYYEGGWHTRPRGGDVIDEPLLPFNGRQFPSRIQNWLKNSIRDRARTEFRQAMFMDTTAGNMPLITSWYFESLEGLSAKYGDLEVKEVASREADQRLTNADMNVLLAICELYSKGHTYSETDQKRIAAFLAEPRYSSTVFIDEVQDFTEIEVFLMGRQADPRRSAVTAVGDFKQQLYVGKVSSLSACFPNANSSELEVAQLTENKRQTKNLANHSLHFRAKISEEGSVSVSGVPEPIYGDDLTSDTCGLETAKEHVLKYIENASFGSVAVILPTDELAEQLESELRDDISMFFRESTYSKDSRDLNRKIDIHFTTPRPTKGLEFDVVIAPYFNHFDLENHIEANSAYVTVSRSRKRLHLIDIH
ncbi:hypothetical protein FV139_12345 [Parahaliea maris]|uniref:Uncharacterized protein n=1 Tax=Parahaliea maris TaxID=2716870 RepID=A0A5C8ZY88_9GAMM|nr:hypothetical protein [Parahaliea maris]TXS92759.1 hypothetical protein FV139_12345 [Parahaliea maris]